MLMGLGCHEIQDCSQSQALSPSVKPHSWVWWVAHREGLLPEPLLQGKATFMSLGLGIEQSACLAFRKSWV